MVIKKRPLFNMKTQLGNVPGEWLRHIEPKIMRGAWLPHWVWCGAVDSRGYPIMYVEKGKNIHAHRFVAKIFYDFPESMWVTRSCGVINCLNPNHLRIK